MSGFAMTDLLTGSDRIGPVLTDYRPVPVNFHGKSVVDRLFSADYVPP